MPHPVVESGAYNRGVCGLMQTLRWRAAGIPPAFVIDIY